MTVARLTYPRLLLVVGALIINFIFLYFHNPSYYYTMTQLHGQVGYNINTFGSVQINPELTDYMHQQRIVQGKLVEYDQLAKEFEPPTKPFIINDTIGYGIILGLLWKLTHSFKFMDVQILQIIIFSLLMLLLYRIMFILSGSAAIAFACCIAQFFYFPILAMNVQPVRDIWAYYGLIILLYGILTYFFEQRSWWILAVCSIGFSVCQFIRPSVFLALLTMLCVIAVYGMVQRAYLKRSMIIVVTALVFNVMCFWMPFMTYNKINYDRYFVGPVGLDLLEGLGEFENPWGYKLSDEWAGQFIEKKYEVKSGTPEFDDACKKEFMHALDGNKSLYFMNIARRIPQLIVPGLPWIYQAQSPYGDALSLSEKIQKIFSSWNFFLDFLMRHIYIRLLLVLGYLGMFVALAQRRYFMLSIMLIGVLCGGLGKLPSHIEYRYLVPYYWVFALFAGYFIASAFKRMPDFLQVHK